MSIGNISLSKDIEFLKIPVYKIVKALAREERFVLEHNKACSREEWALNAQLVSLEKLTREIIGMGWIEKHKKEIDK